VLKALVGLCQAAILIGMSGIAPCAAGHCARHAMGGAMASMPGMSHGQADDSGQADHHAPPSGPHQHGCCGCLGPCASGGLLGLPASASPALVGPLPVAASAMSLDARAVHTSPRLLPFANGPPHHFG